VVYLYNGPDGIATFDTTIKTDQVQALQHDIPFLRSIGVLTGSLDLKRFVDDSLLRSVYGSGYDADAASETNPATISGQDQACDRAVTDQSTAGEVWVSGESTTRPAADATCLLRNVAQVQAAGGTIRAAYIPDAVTGTRWFADKMIWFRTGSTFAAVATDDAATAYAQAHAGAARLTWQQALAAVGSAR
jgi:NitT/TauT family transport system substrate-binding protein